MFFHPPLHWLQHVFTFLLKEYILHICIWITIKYNWENEFALTMMDQLVAVYESVHLKLMHMQENGFLIAGPLWPVCMKVLLQAYWIAVS